MDNRKLPSRGSLESAVLAPLQHCGHCGKRNWDEEKPKRCGGCGVVVYCDKQCQRAAWKAHRVLCRSAPEKDTTLSKELGYATPMALGTALGEWIRIHIWSLNTIVDSFVYLQGGIDALLSSHSSAFFIALGPRHATAHDGNPAEAFEILGRNIIRKGDYPGLRDPWSKMEAHHDAVTKALRELGLFNEFQPSFGGRGILLPAMYLIPKLNIWVFQTHAVLRFPIQHVKDDPQDEQTRASFLELQEVLMGAICHAGIVLRGSSDGARVEPDLGAFVRDKKAWKWRSMPQVSDRFDTFALLRRQMQIAYKTNVPGRSLLTLFDTRNARDAVLRLAPLTVEDSQLVASPDNAEIELNADPKHPLPTS